MNERIIQFVVPVALKDVFDAIAPTFRNETGYEFDLAVMLNPEVPGYIAQGNAWSIAASNPPYIQKVIAGRGCDPKLHNLGYSPLSLAVRVNSDQTGTQNSTDIAGVLRSAKSIAITDTGTSGAQFDGLLDKLDIKDDIQPKVRRLNGGEPMAALLAGQIEMAALPLTNVAPIKGAKSAANCALDLGVHIDLAFCVHENANTATREFAEWLEHPKMHEVFRELGLLQANY